MARETVPNQPQPDDPVAPNSAPTAPGATPAQQRQEVLDRQASERQAFAIAAKERSEAARSQSEDAARSRQGSREIREAEARLQAAEAARLAAAYVPPDPARTARIGDWKDKLEIAGQEAENNAEQLAEMRRLGALDRPLTTQERFQYSALFRRFSDTVEQKAGLFDFMKARLGSSGNGVDPDAVADKIARGDELTEDEAFTVALFNGDINPRTMKPWGENQSDAERLLGLEGSYQDPLDVPGVNPESMVGKALDHFARLQILAGQFGQGPAAGVKTAPAPVRRPSEPIPLAPVRRPSEPIPLGPSRNPVQPRPHPGEPARVPPPAPKPVEPAKPAPPPPAKPARPNPSKSPPPRRGPRRVRPDPGKQPAPQRPPVTPPKPEPPVVPVPPPKPAPPPVAPPAPAKPNVPQPERTAPAKPQTLPVPMPETPVEPDPGKTESPQPADPTKPQPDDPVAPNTDRPAEEDPGTTETPAADPDETPEPDPAPKPGTKREPLLPPPPPDDTEQRLKPEQTTKVKQAEDPSDLIDEDPEVVPELDNGGGGGSKEPESPADLIDDDDPDKPKQSGGETPPPPPKEQEQTTSNVVIPPLPPGDDLGDASLDGEDWPTAVQWRQGVTYRQYDLITGVMTSSRTPAPGGVRAGITPQATLKVIRRAKRRPKIRRFRLGVVNVSVAPNRINFTKPERGFVTGKKQGNGFTDGKKPPGFKS